MMEAKVVLGAFLVFLSSISLAVLVSLVLILSSLFVPSEVVIVVGACLFFSLGLLSFLSFKALKLEKTSLLILTLAMSLIVCFSVYVLSSTVSDFQTAFFDFVASLSSPDIATDPSMFSELGLFNEPITQGMLMVLVVVCTNIFSLFNFFVLGREP